PTPRPARTSRRPVFTSWQAPRRYRHLGWNVHPLGTLIGLGSSPLISARPCLAFGSGTGTALRRASVYGCIGFLITSSALASSTMTPRYITAIRCDMYRVTETSWEMNMNGIAYC